LNRPFVDHGGDLLWVAQETTVPATRLTWRQVPYWRTKFAFFPLVPLRYQGGKAKQFGRNKKSFGNTKISQMKSLILLLALVAFTTADTKLTFVSCPDPDGVHRVAVWSWGDQKSSKVLFCVHELTFQAWEFDSFAKKASEEGYWVLGIDLVGHGASSWLKNKTLYTTEQYLSDLSVVHETLLPGKKVTWIGTGLGGHLGMLLAANPKTFISSLVLNDFGSLVSGEELKKLYLHVGEVPDFGTLDEGVDYLLNLWGWEFGLSVNWTETIEGWIKHAFSYDQKTGFQPGARSATGKYHLRYDPGLRENLQPLIESPTDLDLRLVWSQVKVPTLVLRGGRSKFLTSGISVEMGLLRRTNTTKFLTYPMSAHYPPLVTEDVLGWLQE